MATSEETVDVEAGTAPLERDDSSSSRILLAVGDLHGDYYRLVRHLRELELLLPGTMAWNPERNNVDMVLIGDYTDWRGEALEGSPDETAQDGALGGYRIIDLILHLTSELEKLRDADPSFDSHFYPLLGNHDEMMLHSAEVFSFVNAPELERLLQNVRNYMAWKRTLSDAGMNSVQIEHMFSFLNWYVQGGDVTIQGFGGMEAWRDAMQGEIGDFMRNKLYLGVIINKRLFAHSLPDTPRFWRPLLEIATLPDDDYAAAKESFTWGRKVWGYDYSTGTRANVFTPAELSDLLTGIGGTSAIIGHTPMSHSTEHVVAYDGRVINIDVHGAPGGKAFMETYEGKSSDTVAPLRSELVGPQRVECLA